MKAAECGEPGRLQGFPREPSPFHQHGGRQSRGAGAGRWQARWGSRAGAACGCMRGKPQVESVKKLCRCAVHQGHRQQGRRPPGPPHPPTHQQKPPRWPWGCPCSRRSRWGLGCTPRPPGRWAPACTAHSGCTPGGWGVGGGGGSTQGGPCGAAGGGCEHGQGDGPRMPRGQRAQ